jgi:DNA-binding response OmpR family regulator
MNNVTPASKDRLLVVDDQRLFGDLIGKVGETAGFAVEITTSVEDFLAKATSFDPTVMTIDLLMPGSDGIELLRTLAARNCRARILVISGFDDRMLNSAQVLGRELGLDISGTIAKPIRAGELRKTLELLKV